MSQGDLSIFILRPVSGTLLALLVVVLLAPSLWSLITNRRRQATGNKADLCR